MWRRRRGNPVVRPFRPGRRLTSRENKFSISVVPPRPPGALGPRESALVINGARIPSEAGYRRCGSRPRVDQSTLEFFFLFFFFFFFFRCFPDDGSGGGEKSVLKKLDGCISPASFFSPTRPPPPSRVPYRYTGGGGRT